MPSRFKEHFEVQDILYDYSKPMMDQQDYFSRSESLTNTLDTYSTGSSIRNCTLKRKTRVKPRRLVEDDKPVSLTSTASYNNLLNWCLKQKSKLTRLRRCF
jgi:hypothetical protein